MFKFEAPLFRYPGKAAWHFVTLPKDIGDGIKFMIGGHRGFMPVPVTARIGATHWKTSIFPDKKSASFLLAVKADVRKAEGLEDGRNVSVKIILRDI